MRFRLNPFSEISERPLRTNGWAQAARCVFGYVQVRQGKYQVMWPGAAQARAVAREPATTRVINLRTLLRGRGGGLGGAGPLAPTCPGTCLGAPARTQRPNGLLAPIRSPGRDLFR